MLRESSTKYSSTDRFLWFPQVSVKQENSPDIVVSDNTPQVKLIQTTWRILLFHVERVLVILDLGGLLLTCKK